MRMFLPIKGPGGRYLTPKEKVALLVLGLTLALCVLTLLAGESAYRPESARNPVYAAVALLCRGLGGGVIALYGLILVWSGLIYFRGEKVVRVGPLPGRLFAALCVTVGVSGALGVAHLQTAGGLGSAVGAALTHTMGAGVGFPILILLMLMGVHLAGQGALTALKQSATAAAPGGYGQATGPGLLGFSLREASPARFQDGPPLPDDGDPSPDERSLAITQAMEEIERRKGVTIVEVERTSIGEQVEEIPDPEPESEEGEIQRGIEDVAQALKPPVEEEEAVPELIHGLAPVPPEIREEAIVEEEPEQVEEEEEAEEEAVQGDPYATGGLLKRIRNQEAPAPGNPEAPPSPYTSFDWRGRPLE